MLLTISTTHRPATDLGFLLVKHPDRLRSVDLSFGRAHVFFPEASEERCTAALLVEVDPVRLVRGGEARSGFLLRPYVNDRPYAASSFLSVAISRVLGSALGGTSEHRPELARTAIPLEARLPVVPCRGGEAVLRRFFEPLGYELEVEPIALDPAFPEWGRSRYRSLTLRAEVRLADLLSHLYLLIPALDDDKHYWVTTPEIEKLLRHGKDWLAEHPEKELITRRYLRHQRSLTRDALARIGGEEDGPAAGDQAPETPEPELEKPLRLHDRRLDQVVEVLAELDAKRVLDLGCGDGKLLSRLLRQSRFEEIVGLDVSSRSLEIAASRLRLDEMSERRRQRIRLLQGSLTYRDARLEGFDAAAVVEVIEHIDPGRLDAFASALFGAARPGAVILTTPNAEYNQLFEGLPEGRLRHGDHRFEWSRDEFRGWAETICERHGYTVEIRPVGDEDPDHGAPTQMGIFRPCS